MSVAQDIGETRCSSRITVYYRVMDPSSECTEYLAEPISISMHGLLMRSARKLAVGGRLLLRIRVPIEISGSPFQVSRHTGYVVSEVAMDDGTTAYRIEL